MESEQNQCLKCGKMIYTKNFKIHEMQCSSQRTQIENYNKNNNNKLISSKIKYNPYLK